MNIETPSIIKRLINSFITIAIYLTMELILILQLSKRILISHPLFLMTILLILFLSGLILPLSKKIMSDIIIFTFFSAIAGLTINYAKQLPGSNIQLGHLANTWLGSKLLSPSFIMIVFVWYSILLTSLIIADIFLLKPRYYLDQTNLFRKPKTIHVTTIYILFAMTSILISGFLMPSNKATYSYEGLIKNFYSINTYGASGYGFSTIVNNQFDKLKELQHLDPIIDKFNYDNPDPNEPLYREDSKRENAKGNNYFILSVPGLSPKLFQYDKEFTTLDENTYLEKLKIIYPTLFELLSHATEYTNFYTNEVSYYQESLLSLGARPSYGLANYNENHYDNVNKHYTSLTYSMPRKLYSSSFAYKRIFISGFNEYEFNRKNYFKNMLNYDEVYGNQNIKTDQDNKDLESINNIYPDLSIMKFLTKKLNSSLNLVQATLNSYQLGFAENVNYTPEEINLVKELGLKNNLLNKYYLASLRLEHALKELIDFLNFKNILNKTTIYLVPAKSAIVNKYLDFTNTNIFSLYKINYNQGYAKNTSQVSIYHIAPDIMREEDIKPVNNLFYYPQGLPTNDSNVPLFLPDTLTNSLYFDNTHYPDLTKVSDEEKIRIIKANITEAYFKKQEIIDKYILYPISLGF